MYTKKEFEPQRFAARWSADGRGYLVLEKSKAGGRDIVLYDPASGRREVLVSASLLIPPGQNSPLTIDGYAFSKDRSFVLIYTNSKRVWRKNTRGDYWVLDRSSRQLWKLGGDQAKPSTLMFAKFSPDSRFVAYVRERSLYVEDLRDHTIRALASAGSENVINGTFDWVYEEEFGLRDGFRWSPDGRSIAFWQLDTSGVPRFPLVNNTDSFYPRITWIPYPKTGQRNSACRVGVVRVDTGKTHWVKMPGDPRDNYIARMDWAARSDQIVLQRLNRLQNTNRVMLGDAASGDVETILTEQDEAWVDVHNELKWIDSGAWFTWISERDGWRHVYLVSRSGKQVRRVTSDRFDVVRLLHVDEKQRWIYFIASPENPTQRYLYRIRLDGTLLQRLTPDDQPGTHSYRISPDARWAIHTYSRFGVPPVVDLIRLPDHERVRVLAANEALRAKVAKLKREPVEFFRVEIGDGVKLDAWCIRPPDFDPKKRYPLLIYVYGEPAGQTVLDRWGSSNYLWHLMLAQQGYVIMSFDSRGTPAPRGRAWRKCIYRKLGIVGPEDQAAALRAVLKARPYLDPSRIGVWGWSGGGSSTLHAMFKFPDLYKTGIAIAPVPNQRYYDTIYQERYMGLPSDNVDGYRNGSPIHFAHQLKGNLLIIHGTGDDNCHYATTEMLINELIRHNKPFTMMAYPNRTHAIREGKKTTRHLRQLMTQYLIEHLPPGPRNR
ncbi:MAG: S9 family peptidase [Planctomycetes bacterium]|nr:S9 family peptidase [Planctomycetota bacterium]